MPRPCAYTHTEPLKRQALEAEKERRNIGRFPPEIFLAVYIISYDEHGVMQRALWRVPRMYIPQKASWRVLMMNTLVDTLQKALW